MTGDATPDGGCMNIKELLATRRARHAGTSFSFLALVIAFFYLLNLILLGFADKFGWYFYTKPQYDLTVSDAAAPLFAEIDTSAGGVEIVFCDVEDNIRTHKQLDYVYETAVNLRDRYPELITLTFVNLRLNPDRLSAYRTAKDGTENTLTTSTVIVDYRGEYICNSAAAFYTLDDNNSVTAYNGEEVFVANILWVSAKNHPVAYFTANHGEEVPAALRRQLIYAGYTVARLDLATVSAVPEDAGVVVIASPIYDFQKSAEGASYVSELDKLRTYLDGGGRMLVTLHPNRLTKEEGVTHTGLSRLCEFLSSYGIDAAGGVLTDRENALPGSGGYSLITLPGTGACSDRLQSAQGGRRSVLSYATPLTVSGEAEVLLTSAGSARLLSAAGEEIGSGSYPVLALRRTAEGGMLFVAGSAYLADDRMVNAEGYGNRELIYGLLAEMGATRSPAGIRSVVVDRSALENLTLQEADIYAVISIAVIPAALLLSGLIVIRRRKNH